VVLQQKGADSHLFPKTLTYSSARSPLWLVYQKNRSPAGLPKAWALD
jgi:hypothetical protein